MPSMLTLKSAHPVGDSDPNPQTVTDTSEHIRFYFLVLLWFRAVD